MASAWRIAETGVETSPARRTLARVAAEVRSAFVRRQVDRALLARLYEAYQPIPDVESFVARALCMFPNLCCGLASVALRERLPEATITRGAYAGARHTFVLARGLVVDVTADQFGGPPVYVGPPVWPWEPADRSPRLGRVQPQEAGGVEVEGVAFLLL